MSLSCPHCGTHLTVTLTEPPTATSTAAAATADARRKTIVPAKNPSPHNVNTTDADLHGLKHMMCFPYSSTVRWKPTQPTLRPIVSDKEDEVGVLKDSSARQTLDRTARKMHATIRACGAQSANTLLESRERSRTPQDLHVSMSAVFEAVGAMIYAMEWTNTPPRAGELAPPQAVIRPLEAGRPVEPPAKDLFGCASTLRSLFQVMLVIDYGFPDRRISGWVYYEWPKVESFAGFLVKMARLWRWRQGLPSDKAWGLIAEASSDWADDFGLRLPVWDVATMIYYYCTHRKPVEAEELKEGWTGYTGVLKEMIAEVPTRGTDRLERKLSLDAHILIPRFVGSRKLRTQMLLIAQDLAAKHGCQLAPPEMPKPPLWRRLLGRVPSQEGPEDTEKGHEDLQILEGLDVKAEGSDQGDLHPSCVGEKCQAPAGCT